MKNLVKELKEFLKKECRRNESLSFSLKSEDIKQLSYFAGKISGLDTVYSYLEKWEYMNQYKLQDFRIKFKKSREEFIKEYPLTPDKVFGKIIGYKAPCDMFGGLIKKGWHYSKIENNYRCLRYDVYSDNKLDCVLPSEIVETWEAVYEEEKNPKIKTPKKKYTKKDMLDFVRYLMEDTSYDTIIELFKAWKKQRS